MFACLLCLPGQQHLPDFPELPISSSYSNFRLQSTAFCSSGSAALAAEAAQKRCARVPVLSPAGPGSPTAGCQSNRQPEAASTAALCSQRSPFFWDSPVSVLPTLLIRTQLFHNILSPPALKNVLKSNSACATLQMLFGLDVQIASVFLFCLYSTRVAHEDISRDGAGDTAPKPVTFCVSGSCTEGTCQKRASSAD